MPCPQRLIKQHFFAPNLLYMIITAICLIWEIFYMNNRNTVPKCGEMEADLFCFLYSQGKTKFTFHLFLEIFIFFFV